MDSEDEQDGKSFWRYMDSKDSNFCCVKTWLRRDLREHLTLQCTVESRFGGLVANVDKQQCQLCHHVVKWLEVCTASGSKL